MSTVTWDENFNGLFISYILSRIMPCKTADGSIELIFDSNQSRRIIKWPTCLSRRYNNFKEIDTRQMAWGLPSNVVIKVADFDADNEIYVRIKMDLNTSAHTINHIFLDEERKVEISNLAIFSADSDFLCFFPNKIHCCVLNVIEHPIDPQLGHNQLPFSYLLRNFHCKLRIETRDEIINPIKNNYSGKFFSIENFLDFHVKIFGMLSSNDYLTCCFIDYNLICKITNEFSFKCNNNFSDNLGVYRTIATIYLSEYFQKNHTKKELFSNSLRLLNYDGNIFFHYDLISNQTTIPLNYYSILLDKLKEIVWNFNVETIRESERKFKYLDKTRVERVPIKNFLRVFLKRDEESVNCEMRRDFGQISCCAIAFLFTSLLFTFFQHDKKFEFQIHYFAQSVKCDKHFLKKLLGYFNFEERDVIFYKIKHKSNFKIFYKVY